MTEGTKKLSASLGSRGKRVCDQMKDLLEELEEYGANIRLAKQWEWIEKGVKESGVFCRGLEEESEEDSLIFHLAWVCMACGWRFSSGRKYRKGLVTEGEQRLLHDSEIESQVSRLRNEWKEVDPWVEDLRKAVFNVLQEVMRLKEEEEKVPDGEIGSSSLETLSRRLDSVSKPREVAELYKRALIFLLVSKVERRLVKVVQHSAEDLQWRASREEKSSCEIPKYFWKALNTDPIPERDSILHANKTNACKSQHAAIDVVCAALRKRCEASFDHKEGLKGRRKKRVEGSGEDEGDVEAAGEEDKGYFEDADVLREFGSIAVLLAWDVLAPSKLRHLLEHRWRGMDMATVCAVVKGAKRLLCDEDLEGRTSAMVGELRALRNMVSHRGPLKPLDVVVRKIQKVVERGLRDIIAGYRGKFAAETARKLLTELTDIAERGEEAVTCGVVHEVEEAKRQVEEIRAVIACRGDGDRSLQDLMKRSGAGRRMSLELGLEEQTLTDKGIFIRAEHWKLEDESGWKVPLDGVKETRSISFNVHSSTNVKILVNGRKSCSFSLYDCLQKRVRIVANAESFDPPVLRGRFSFSACEDSEEEGEEYWVKEVWGMDTEVAVHVDWRKSVPHWFVPEVRKWYLEKLKVSLMFRETSPLVTEIYCPLDLESDTKGSRKRVRQFIGVELHVEEGEGEKEGEVKRREVTEEDVLGGGEEGTLKVRLEGVPGVGKTTILKHWAQLWAEGRSEALRCFDLVVLLPLHLLEGAVELGVGDVREEHLWAAAFHNVIEDVGRKTGGDRFDIDECVHLMQQFLSHSHLKVLYLLDGLDEVGEEQRKRATRLLQQLKDKPSYVYTTRSLGSRTLLSSNAAYLLTGFCKSQQDAFIDFYLGDADIASNVKGILDSHGALRELARVPVLLEMLCAAVQEGQGGKGFVELLQSENCVTPLYDASLDLLLVRWAKKHVSESGGEEAVDDFLSEHRDTLLGFLRRAAARCWRKKIVTPKGEFLFQELCDHLGHQLTPFEKEIYFKRNGILCPLMDGGMKGWWRLADWGFPHKTFLELLAAQHLFQNLQHHFEESCNTEDAEESWLRDLGLHGDPIGDVQDWAREEGASYMWPFLVHWGRHSEESRVKHATLSMGQKLADRLHSDDALLEAAWKVWIRLLGEIPRDEPSLGKIVPVGNTWQEVASAAAKEAQMVALEVCMRKGNLRWFEAYDEHRFLALDLVKRCSVKFIQRVISDVSEDIIVPFLKECEVWNRGDVATLILSKHVPRGERGNVLLSIPKRSTVLLECYKAYEEDESEPKFVTALLKDFRIALNKEGDVASGEQCFLPPYLRACGCKLHPPGMWKLLRSIDDAHSVLGGGESSEKEDSGHDNLQGALACVRDLLEGEYVASGTEIVRCITWQLGESENIFDKGMVDAVREASLVNVLVRIVQKLPAGPESRRECLRTLRILAYDKDCWSEISRLCEEELQLEMFGETKCDEGSKFADFVWKMERESDGGLDDAIRRRDLVSLWWLLQHPGVSDGDKRLVVHTAARHGFVDCLFVLKTCGIEIDSRGAEDETPMHVAATHGHRKFCRALYEHGASVCVFRRDGYTPFHCAAAEGNADVCGWFASLIGNTWLSPEEHLHPIHVAARYNRSNVCKLLLQLPPEEGGVSANLTTRFDTTAIHFAAQEGSFEACKALLENGGDPSALRHNNTSPLHDASCAKMARLLIRYKATADEKLLTSGSTPLHTATEHNRVDVLQVLLDSFRHLVNVKDSDGCNPLHVAFKIGSIDACLALHAHGADMFATSNDGLTPFFVAAKAKKIDTCAYFLEVVEEESLEVTDDKGWNLLHKAAQHGFHEIFGLLHHRYDIEGRTKPMVEWTPLHCAAKYGHAQFCKVLLDIGATSHAVDGRGWTSFHLAVSAGHVETCKMLCECGCESHLRIVSKERQTPLHIAVLSEEIECCQYLVSLGIIDLEVKDDTDLTALEWAVMMGAKEMCKILADGGAIVATDDVAAPSPLKRAIKEDKLEVIVALCTTKIPHLKQSTWNSLQELTENEGIRDLLSTFASLPQN